MTFISQLTPAEVKEATITLGKGDPQLDLINAGVTLSEELTETIRRNTLVPSKIHWKYLADYESGYQEYDDCCTTLSKPCTYNRDYSQEIDIEETYKAIIKIGGASPESALKQTASIIERFQAWQEDKWHFGGLAVTLYASSEAEPESFEEIARESIWGVFSDETAEYVQEMLDDLRDQATAYAVREGYSEEAIKALEMQEYEWPTSCRGCEDQGYLENYPKRRGGNHVYGEDAKPLEPLPSFKGKQLGAFAFSWYYADRGRSIGMKARCTQCDEEFLDLSFATPAESKRSKAELLDMSAHSYGCYTWAESTWKTHDRKGGK